MTPVSHSLQLRVIVYNVQEVVLSDTSFTGEKMSDIYVKGYESFIKKHRSVSIFQFVTSRSQA